MLQELKNIVKQVCRDFHVALYDMEMKSTQKGKIFLIYITKINGVNVEDCRSVSKKIGEILDEKDLIKEHYFLEVSSPGVERNLKLKSHYISAINEFVKIEYLDGAKIVKKGNLKEVNQETLTLEMDNGEECSIKFSDIKKARTFYKFNK